MSKGTYIHSSKNGWTFDGVPEGSRWACDLYELTAREKRAMDAENGVFPEGATVIDRFLVVTGRADPARQEAA